MRLIYAVSPIFLPFQFQEIENVAILQNSPEVRGQNGPKVKVEYIWSLIAYCYYPLVEAPEYLPMVSHHGKKENFWYTTLWPLFSLTAEQGFKYHFTVLFQSHEEWL